ARVTARLQHPGIPPIHEMGILADGRPFLAMKLIQGRTLQDLLHEEGPGVSVVGHRWLGVFEAVCRAMAYAHSQGIIHRDLKPGNVRVGAFGEVQVRDWGLAKVLDARNTDPAGYPEETATASPSLRDSDGFQTRPGIVMGTPVYMPPEQALGAVDKI